MNKSPLNYIGGKYKLLPQILPLFPQQIDTFVDLFAGGLDVTLNVNANHYICNDINHFVVSVYQYFQERNIDEILLEVQNIIRQYSLSKENADGYYALREEYNLHHNPLHLFTLVCFGFNHQFRFNSSGEFNNPFGKNRSSYNSNIEKHLRAMLPLLRNKEFRSENFKALDLSFLRAGDFVYADPPYLISRGSYNDGKRGFEGWNEDSDRCLFNLLDDLNDRRVAFALSNVTHHKGMVNQKLIDWASKYTTHIVESSYENSNYQAKKTLTTEVLITNY